MRLLLTGILLSAFLLTGCSEEEHPIDAYRKDFSEILTNTNGGTSYLVPDNGDTLHIANPLYGLQADTTYRQLATYVINENVPNQARLVGLTPILVLTPFTTSAAHILSDYVNPVSIWRGGNYLNLTLDILTRGKGHKFALVHYGFVEADNGTRTLQTVLYHDANQDKEAYTRRVYLSAALHQFQSVLQQGRDSISITLNSRKEGVITRTIPY